MSVGDKNTHVDIIQSYIDRFSKIILRFGERVSKVDQ